MTALSTLARLDTCVTVIDASNFMSNFESVENVKDRAVDVAEEDERTIADLMTDQLEFADVVIINKADLVTAEGLAAVKEVVNRLNPTAEVITSTDSIVPLEKVGPSSSRGKPLLYILFLAPQVPQHPLTLAWSFFFCR